MKQDGMVNAKQKYDGTLNRNNSYTNNRPNGLSTEETDVQKPKQREIRNILSGIYKIEDRNTNNKVNAPSLI